MTDGRKLLDDATSERAFQSAIVAEARLRGWAVQFTWTSMHSPEGWPDLFLVRGTRIIAAELKREGKQPTPAQAAWLDRLAATGKVEAYLWYPGDRDEITAVLT